VGEFVVLEAVDMEPTVGGMETIQALEPIEEREAALETLEEATVVETKLAAGDAFNV